MANIIIKKSGYNNGLGCYVGSEGQKRDAIRRIQDTTGRTLVEVGNDRMDIKPKRKSYEPTRAEAQKIFAGIDIGA